MGHGLAPTADHRERRLGTIECLNLRFLVHTQDDCLIRRVEIQTDYISELLEKLPVGRQLEGSHPMRMKVVSVPDAMDSLMTNTRLLRHAAGTPVGGIGGFGQQSRV